MIACRTLGPVEVVVDGGPAPSELLWRKHLALLLYLARAPRQTRTREHLIGVLWPDKPGPAARHSLNEAIRILRRMLGQEGVDTTSGGVRLVPGAVCLDVDRLTKLAAAGQWAEAAELIEGEFLEGFGIPDASEFEDWLAGERGRWRTISVDVLLRRAEELQRGGQANAGADLALRALGLDPCSEPAARVAIKCLAVTGERAAAMRCYETIRAKLAERIGVEPEAETRALAERVRSERGRPSPRGTRSGRERGEAPSRPPLAGRENELELLLTTAETGFRDRRPALLIVEGDGGTGKTRLVEEWLSRLRLDGAAVAFVRAVPADRDDEWSGVLAVARGGLLAFPALASAPPPALACFAGRITEWAEAFPGAARGEPAISFARALGDVLRTVCDERPIALAVDDAQWLDRPSALALLALLRDLATAPLALLFAAQPHPLRPEIDETRSRIGRDHLGASVRLGPLAPEALRRLARHFLPRYGDLELDRVTRRVHTDSAGLPFLAVELLRAVALGLDLGTITGTWPAPLRTLDHTLPGELPDAVVAALRVTFRRLSAPAQQVLAAAAVLDDRVEPGLLARATALPTAEVSAALDELEWDQWLAAEPRGYTFVARIAREVIVRDMLTPGQRRRILEAARDLTPS